MSDDELVRLRKENEQLNARLHCMCGSGVEHSTWEGHSPVSMYDHALDQAEADNARLRAALGAIRECPGTARQLQDIAIVALGVEWRDDKRTADQED